MPGAAGLATEARASASTNLPVVLVLVGLGIAVRLLGVFVFQWQIPHPPIALHCLLGLGLEFLALGLALRRRPDFALLVVGLDLAWIAMLTPRFGTASLLFLFGLMHPFLVLIMTRWSVGLRILLAFAPPATFAALRFATPGAPADTGLLAPDQLRHLATANVLIFIVSSMTITAHTLRLTERSRRRAEGLAEARSRLIDDMSHELRTPVSIVLTAAQGALGRERTGDSYRETLGLVERQARSLGRIVRRMLEMSRAERGEPAIDPVDDLVSSVHGIVDAYRDLARERGVELRLEAGAAGTPAARTDAAALWFVLGNLLSNAIRHSPEGGEVEIQVGALGPRPTISVRDHGPGIAEEDLPHLFERYWKADPARPSQGAEAALGLGLAIARRYARLIGATVEVESTLGRGSTFFVRW